jgi:transcriptional regulator with XRE-family HTH domain
VSAKPSPVTPAVLGWALDEDGRSRRALSEALDVDPDTLDAWLAGDARPTRGQVTALAKVLRRPRAVFFLPRPPTASTLPASFRHPPGDERLVSVEARRRVRQARRVQQAVSWALADRAGVDLPQAITGEPVEATAGRAREWLTVSDDDQAGWRDDYAALRSWRAALERREILVFALDVGRGVCGASRRGTRRRH